MVLEIQNGEQWLTDMDYVISLADVTEKEVEKNMIGVCPNCGKPFKMEEGKGGEGWTYCADVCIVPAALPTGERLQADQATIKYTDGEAVKAWREEQVEKWKA